MAIWWEDCWCPPSPHQACPAIPRIHPPAPNHSSKTDRNATIPGEKHWITMKREKHWSHIRASCNTTPSQEIQRERARKKKPWCVHSVQAHEFMIMKSGLDARGAQRVAEEKSAFKTTPPLRRRPVRVVSRTLPRSGDQRLSYVVGLLLILVPLLVGSGLGLVRRALLVA